MNEKEILSTEQSVENLASFLDNFPIHIGIPKTTFESLLSTAMGYSPSAIHNILLTKRMPKIWYNPNEEENNLFKLKESVVQVIDQYMENPENKVTEERLQKWNELRDMFSQCLDCYYVSIMLPAMRARYQECLSDNFAEKLMFTMFLQTDWETANLENTDELRSLLQQLTRYLKNRAEIQNLILSEEDICSVESITKLLLSPNL